MDSLGIHGMASIVGNIYSYLENEWKTKKQTERKFDRTTIPLIDCRNIVSYIYYITLIISFYDIITIDSKTNK